MRRTCCWVVVAHLALGLAAEADLIELDAIELNNPRLGKEPWGVAACGATGMAYVACIHGPSELIAIDVAENRITGFAPLSGLFPHGIEVEGTGRRIYVANYGGSVAIVDASSLSEVVNTTLAGQPMDLCLLPPHGTAQRVYVADRQNARLWVLDADSGGLMHTIGVGNYPNDLCAHPLTSRLYVANLSDGTVSVIDAAADTLVTTIPVGSYPEGIAIDIGLNRIYVANRDDNTVSAIDGQTNLVIGTYPVGESPRRLAVDPLSHRLYVANGEGNDVTVLSSGGLVEGTVPAGLSPVGGVSVDPVAGRVLVCNHTSDDLTVFPTTPPWSTQTIRIRFGPGQLALAPPIENDDDPASVMVANGWGDDVLHLDPLGGGHPRTLRCGYAPTDIATRLHDGLIAVTLGLEDALILVDGETGLPVDTVAVGDDPRGVCLREDRDIAYVANFEGGSLSVIDVSTGTIIDTIPFEMNASAFDVGVDEVLDRIYVTTWWGWLWILDGTTHEEIERVNLSGFYEPNQLVVDESHHLVYVNAMNCNVSWVVDGREGNILATVPLPGFPRGITVNEQLRHAYICAGTQLVGLDEHHAIFQTLPLPADLGYCATDPRTHRVYVGGIDDGGGRLFVVLDRVWAVQPSTPVRLARGSSNPISRGQWPIRFQSAATRSGALTIFDAAGRQIRRLAGEAWDGTDARGCRVPGGIYFARSGRAQLRLVVVE